MLRFAWILLLCASVGMAAAQEQAPAPQETPPPAEQPPEPEATPPAETPAAPAPEAAPVTEAAPQAEVPAEEAAPAQPDPQAILTQILSGEMLAEDRFTPEFLAEVPLAEVERIVTQTRQTIGEITEITPENGRFIVRTASHEMAAEISLDGNGRIQGLFFHAPIEIGRDLDALLGEVTTLPGQVSYLITRDGQNFKSHEPDKALAVGSAFKLGVLAALLDRVKNGDARWTDVASLESRQISLPTGILQTFPVGSPLTLHTLAALMISISDNTATDILIDQVGRQAVAEKLGADFALKTRELFLLKADPELAERFRTADAAGKGEIAGELDGRQVSAAGANGQHVQGLEWYVPASRLCQLVDAVAGLDVMSISPGPINATDWQRVAYKGGSETGVINFTAAVTGKTGQRFCVALTWNNEAPLDNGKIASIYGAILRQLSLQ